MTIQANKFPPGSKWLYIRIYGGPQALEEWLTGAFRTLLDEWRDSGLVEQFHFVHYLDPEYHVRIRFLLPEPLHSGILLTRIQHSCRLLLDEDLIWKIEVGTYEPEYQRYGSNRISLVESWFELDSMYWLDEIDRCAGKDEPDLWKSALRSVDVLLNDFGASEEDKINIINRLRKSAGMFMGLTRSMQVDLDEKYRRISGELVPVLESGPGRTDRHLEKRSADNRELVQQLKDTFSDSSELMSSEFLPDLIHISLNRAFRTRHRMQELVIYDFLGRHYESERAKGVKRDA